MSVFSDAMVVGLARAGVPPSSPHDPGESLVAAVEPAIERALLLRAGVAAVRARAGFLPVAGVAVPEGAPVALRPPCSLALASLIAELCTVRDLTLVAEALTAVDGRGLTIPPAVIPAIADLGHASLMPAASRVCGERGLWLAAQNPDWRWLIAPTAPASREARRRSWDDGPEDARIIALRAVREEDAAAGRAWIEEAWKQEKAAVRQWLVETLRVALSPEDEPLLNKALADRAAGVRAAAGLLLAQLPESGFAVRARARAEAVISYQPPATAGVLGSLRSLVAPKPAGVLTVTPPAAFQKAWADDGLAEKPPVATGEKAFWIGQIVALVSPEHWTTRFEARPEELVAAAARSDWADVLIDAWTDAAGSAGAAAWAPALWDARPYDKQSPEQLTSRARRLFPLFDATTLDTRVIAVVRVAHPVVSNALVRVLHKPWSEPIADAVLGAVAKTLAARPEQGLAWQDAHAVKGLLELTATAVPPAMLARARAIVPDVTDGALRGALDSFRSVLTIRHRIHQETRP